MPSPIPSHSKEAGSILRTYKRSISAKCAGSRIIAAIKKWMIKLLPTMCNCFVKQA